MHAGIRVEESWRILKPNRWWIVRIRSNQRLSSPGQMPQKTRLIVWDLVAPALRLAILCGRPVAIGRFSGVCFPRVRVREIRVQTGGLPRLALSHA